jgi:hypothetical protein
MTRISIRLFVALSLATSIAWAQVPAPTMSLQPEAVPRTDPVETAQPLLLVEQPGVKPQWTQERQRQNQQGTVTNTHRYLDASEEGRYVREHMVTNPHGEMTQTWERMHAEEGYDYRRSQVWTKPDGTPLRQHEWTMAGTDPYNYTREHTITLPDGRMINHSQVRTWDGTDGTMERSFTGPSGQTRESVRSWTPDKPITGQMGSTAEPVQPSTVIPATPQPTTPATLPPTEQLSWWQKLNPFGKRGNETSGAAAASGPRRGFTIGTSGSNSARPSTVRAGEHPSVHASQNALRPSWAGGAPHSMFPQGPPAHANGQATASRPNVGHGPPNR